MNIKVVFFEALRFITHLKRNFPNSYKGDIKQLAKAIIEERWNGKFLEAGREIHLSQFWIRDFGIHCESIGRLGYHEYVRKSLEWAIGVYRKNGHVHTTATECDVAYDVYHYAADSLMWLLHSIVVTKNTDLIESNKSFFQQEITKVYNEIFDSEKLTVKHDKYFSIPKDVVLRKFTAVSNIFLIKLVLILERDLPSLNNPFPKSELLIKRFNELFWHHNHFHNDLEQDDIKIVASDPSIWAYWAGITSDDQNRLILEWLNKEGYVNPFPIKFHLENFDHLSARWGAFLLPNYQGNSIWTMVTHIYFTLLEQYHPDKAKKQKAAFIKMIEDYGNYYEVFDPDGKKPLKGRFGFGSGTGMIWIASIANN